MISSLQDLKNIVSHVDTLISNKNIVVLLRGDLAAGKTTLVKEYLKYKNLKDEVTSPTFCLQNEYSSNIFHYDMYNKTLQEFISLGLLEEFEKPGIHFVEWGEDNLKAVLYEYGFEVITIDIIKHNDKREYKIES